MKNTRMWLIILSLLSIASIALMGIFSQAIQEGKIANDWMGVFGLLMTGSVLTNMFISYRYAWKTGRQAGLWAIGALLLPYAAPLVLAILPESSSGIEVHSEVHLKVRPNPTSISKTNSNLSHTTKENLFTSISEPTPVFNLKEGLFQSSQWHLDQLRLFCIIVPGSTKWRVVASSQEQSFHFPDLMPSEDAAILYSHFDELCSSGNPNDLSGIKLCMASYDNNGSVISLHKLKKNSTALMAGLYHFRSKRSERLEQWLAGNPQILLRGGLGSRATLDKNGFHLKKRSLSWPQVEKINTETTNGLVTHMFVLPEGRSGGLFDMKKGKYALARIPTKKKELYAAESFFWKTYCGT